MKPRMAASLVSDQESGEMRESSGGKIRNVNSVIRQGARLVPSIGAAAEAFSNLSDLRPRCPRPLATAIHQQAGRPSFCWIAALSPLSLAFLHRFESCPVDEGTVKAGKRLGNHAMPAVPRKYGAA